MSTQPSLTLDEALREARNANAHLPIAAIGIDIARTSVREVKASHSPNLALTSSVNTGGPLAYTTSQGAAQAVGAATMRGNIVICALEPSGGSLVHDRFGDLRYVESVVLRECLGGLS